jgi:RNA polymerase sigma factor (sigma-70 family)
MQSERERLGSVAAGDQAALKALYQSYYPRMVRFLLRVTGDPELVPEIINDVWLAVWEQAKDYRGDATVSTWVLSIAWRKAARAMSRRRHTEPLDEHVAAHPDHADGVGGVRDLVRALDALSPEHRAVVELVYDFGYSYAEIGAILGCPENTVKTRMFYARRALGNRLRVETDG